MTFILGASGTKTPTLPSTCTFSNGSANIGVTNTCAAGDMVVFTSTGTLPTNFALLTIYYVIATGLSGSNIQVSATPGGSAITAGSAGSGTQTGTFEHVLDAETTNATYQPVFDLSVMQLGDLVELRVYTTPLSGGSLTQYCKGAWQHAQINGIKIGPALGSDIDFQITLKQLAGTARAFKWKTLRI